MRYTLAVVALIFGLYSCGAAGSKSGEPSSRLREQAVALSKIEANQRATDSHKLCVRLPPSGPDVVLVVEQGGDKYAQQLLRRLKILGTVKILSQGEYDHELGEVERYVREHVPLRFRPLAINGNVVLGPTCQRVHIELPTGKETPPGLLAWAKAMVRRFGSDRLDYRHDAGPKPAYSRNYSPPVIK